MNPQQPNPPQFNSRAKVGNDLTVLQQGERVICTVKRHPIGIIAIYAATAIILIIVGILSFGVLPSLAGSNSTQIAQIGAIAFLTLTIVSVVYCYVATHVYWGNSWTVTTDSITQISQVSLFKRQSSQLSLANLEDVTAEQNGILANMFNYGVIKAETAGERSKFMFLYCPNPNLYAQQILQAREVFEQKLEQEGRQGPPSYNTNQYQQQQPVTNPEPPVQSDTSGFNSNV